jgi:hypothetical protein
MPLGPAQTPYPPAERQDLRYLGTCAERGKPVVFPQGTADRKESLGDSGYRTAEEAKAAP